MQIVTTPDGVTHQFPDEATPDMIAKALNVKVGAPPDTSFGARAYRLAGGFVRGLRDYVDAPAQMLERGAAAVGVPTKEIGERFARGGQALGLPTTATADEAVRAAEEDYQKNWRGGVEGVDVGRIAGNIAPSLAIPAGAPAATLASAAGRGVMVGAGANVLTQPVTDTDNFWREKLLQAGVGAGSGIVGGAAGHVAGRVISPQTRPEVEALRQAGVKLTPGQTLGGVPERIEQRLTSIPALGDAIKAAQSRSLQSFNRAAINKALSPIGQKLDMKTPLGREAITEAGEKISKAYDDILPKLAVKVDGQFIDDMTKLDELTGYLPAAQREQFSKIVYREVFDRFSRADAMTGETMKQVESKLGQLARQYRSAADPDQRQLGAAIREVQDTLRRLVMRSNPGEAKQLSKINEAYSNFLRVESAAASLGSKEGVFTGAQLKGAVRRLDSSLNKRAFARGKATMQDLAESGAEVLGSKVPDSGTPERMFLAGGVPLATWLLSNPEAALASGLLTGAAMLPYAPGAGAVARGVLASRPPGAAQAAEAIRRSAPAVTALGLPAWLLPALEEGLERKN